MKVFILRCAVWLGKRINPGGLLRWPAFARYWDLLIVWDVNHCPELEEFQKRDTLEILRVIYKNFPNPRRIRVLDIGCSACVVKYLAGHVGQAVGINIEKDHLEQKHLPANAALLYMDGTKLLFKDKAFDFVYCANVYEHVSNLSQCIDEQVRVANDHGLCYARWEPVWSGPRGHHIHDDTVRNFDVPRQASDPVYTNDGRFIPDWTHLLFSKEEMFDHLVPKLRNSLLVKRIVENMYDSKHLNRLFYDEVKAVFSGKPVDVLFWHQRSAAVPADMYARLRSKFPHTNFDGCSGEILFRRRHNQQSYNNTGAQHA